MAIYQTHEWYLADLLLFCVDWSGYPVIRDYHIPYASLVYLASDKLHKF